MNQKELKKLREDYLEKQRAYNSARWKLNKAKRDMDPELDRKYREKNAAAVKKCQAKARQK